MPLILDYGHALISGWKNIKFRSIFHISPTAEPCPAGRKHGILAIYTSGPFFRMSLPPDSIIVPVLMR
jgi:hypothetical protein